MSAHTLMPSASLSPRKAEVLAAGFRLDGESNALANPADNHTNKVFEGDTRGKTDQFVLRFKKP